VATEGLALGDHTIETATVVRGAADFALQPESAPLTCRLAYKAPLQSSEGVGERDAIRFL